MSEQNNLVGHNKIRFFSKISKFEFSLPHIKTISLQTCNPVLSIYIKFISCTPSCHMMNFYLFLFRFVGIFLKIRTTSVTLLWLIQLVLFRENFLYASCFAMVLHLTFFSIFEHCDSLRFGCSDLLILHLFKPLAERHRRGMSPMLKETIILSSSPVRFK